VTLAASAQLSIFDENNTPQDKGQVGVTILSQKSTKAHRLFVYDSSKQGMATAELNPDLRAVVQSEVYLTFYDSLQRYCTLKFGSKTQALQFESKINELIEDADRVESTDFEVGKGDPIAEGDTARIQYTGWLDAGDGTKGAVFDSNTDQNPFTFELGGSTAIPGMSKGLLGMARGGRREFRIPPQLAYGTAGSPPKIPGNSSLIFEVNLLRIKRGAPKALLPAPQPAAAAAAAPAEPAPAAAPSTPSRSSPPPGGEDESVTERASRLSGELGGGMLGMATPPGGIKAAVAAAAQRLEHPGGAWEGQQQSSGAGSIVPIEEHQASRQQPPQAGMGSPQQPGYGHAPPPQGGAYPYPPPQYDAYGRPFPPMQAPPGQYYQPPLPALPPGAPGLPLSGGGDASIDGKTKYQIDAIERKIDTMTVKIEEILTKGVAANNNNNHGAVAKRRGSTDEGEERAMAIRDAEGITGEVLVLAIERLVEQAHASQSKADEGVNMEHEMMELLREKSNDLKERNEELKESNTSLKEQVMELKQSLSAAGGAGAELATAKEELAKQQEAMMAMEARATAAEKLVSLSETLVEEANEKWNAAEARAEAAEEELKQAQKEKGQGSEEAEAAAAKIAASETSIAELEASLAALVAAAEETAAKHKEEVEAAEAKLGPVSEELSSAVSKLEEKEEAIVKLIADHAVKEAEQAEQAEGGASAEELQEAKAKVEELTGQLEAAQGLGTRVAELEEKLLEAVGAAEAANAEVEEANAAKEAAVTEAKEESSKEAEGRIEEEVTSKLAEGEEKNKETTKLLMENIYEVFAGKINPDDSYEGNKVMSALRSIIKKQTKALLKGGGDAKGDDAGDD